MDEESAQSTALTQSTEDGLILCEVLHTIASTSDEASTVRQCVGALQRTSVGLMYLQMHPIID